MRGVIVVISMGLSAVSFGQPGRIMQEQHQQFLFFEAVNLITADSTKSRVDIHYRIDHQFFIPVRNPDAAIDGTFKRSGEVLVELLDVDGASKAREIHRFTIGTNKSENVPTDPREWYQGISSHVVPPGKYTLAFEVTDLESERRFLDRSKTVEAKTFAPTLFETSTPMFVERAAVRETLDSLIPSNYAGNIGFGNASGLFLQIASSSSEPITARYSIVPATDGGNRQKAITTDTLETVVTMRGISLEVNRAKGSFFYRPVREENGTVSVFIPIPSEKFPLDNYSLDLTVHQGESEKRMKLPFRLVWPEMPVSLRDVDIALDAIRFITSEDELDSLKSGSRESRKKHLDNFWRAKDRTAGTAYNEVMVEYYRRVDFATRHFTTLREPDGSRSDRGRIFILYGPPTKKERSLDPAAGFQEIWYYDTLNKKFIFLDQSKTGNYMLVSTQSL